VQRLLLEWLRDYPGGAALSERFKGAFRVALAMVITYGISMAMDWDKTFWAALSVIFCSLATSGESINASIDRIAGTFAAAVLALLLVALFPQDRWLFLTGISVVIAVCSYRMTGPTLRSSVWFNAGFSLPIIAFLGEAGSNLEPATFDVAILRVQQTALGATVYSLVAMLVWPRRGDEGFVDTVRSIGKTQHELFSNHVDLLLGRADDNAPQKLMADVAGQLPLLGSKLEGAAYDNPDAELMKGAWASHLRNVKALHTAFERWDDGYEDLKGLDLRRYMPDLEAFIQEVEQRFRGVDQLLTGQAPAQVPQELVLPLDERALAELSHFQRASVVCCRDQLLAIGGLASSLFESARRIHSGEPGEAGQAAPRRPREPWVLDLDRLSTTIRQTTALWLSFLAIIYIEGVPIVVAVIAMTNAFPMAMGKLPHLPAIILYRPVIQGGLFGGAFYMFVMPQLTQFWQFGLCLFAAVFAVAYIFHQPRAILFKYLWMTMLVLIIGADNHPTYSFLQFANWFLVGVIFVTLMAIAWRFPISFRAEDRLHAQLRRYWLSAAFMLRHLDRQGDPGFASPRRRAFHEHQLSALPPRLSTWASVLSPTALEDPDRQRLQALLRNLRLFSQRMNDLDGAYPEAGQLGSIGELYSHGKDLRLRMAALMDQIARDPAAFSKEYQLEAMAQTAVDLQQRVEDMLNSANISRDEAQRAYYFLGAYRGLLAAFRRAVEAVVQIDWQRLQEARF
jgi:uncharacterized membrane protein YccC